MLLDYYTDRHFIKPDGTLDTTTNVETITRMTKEKYKLVLNNTFQLTEDVVFYPNDYFCPKSYDTGKINLTENTYVIHHFSGSWKEEVDKKKHQSELRIINVFGEKIGRVLIRIKRKYGKNGWFWNK